MSNAEVRVESALMPDWNRRGTDEIDRVDWQPFVELGKAREPAPRAAQPDQA